MENGDSRGSHGQAYKDKSKPTDIRSSNINAAKGKNCDRRSRGSSRDVSSQFDQSWRIRAKPKKILPYIAMDAFASRRSSSRAPKCNGKSG